MHAFDEWDREVSGGGLEITVLYSRPIQLYVRWEKPIDQCTHASDRIIGTVFLKSAMHEGTRDEVVYQ